MSDHDNHRIELTGLDGSNPLAFLAALGVLRCLDLDAVDTKPRLAWTSGLRPVVCSREPLIAASLANTLRRTAGELATNVTRLGDIIGVAAEAFRLFAKGNGNDDPLAKRTLLAFAAAYGSDAVVDAKKGTVVPTALSFSNGQGGKLLLKDFRTLAGRLTDARVAAALFEPWRYEDFDEPTFRWDPLDMRTGAHMATDPGSTRTRSVMAANALAFVGLSFLPTVPTAHGLRTTAVRPVDGEPCLTWPLWQYPLGADAVASLLQRPDWPDALGIVGRFAARRIMYKKNLYLGSSFAV